MSSCPVFLVIAATIAFAVGCAALFAPQWLLASKGVHSVPAEVWMR